MDLTAQINHELYIHILRRMTPEQRLRKALELTELQKRLLRAGLRESFPHVSLEDLQDFMSEALRKMLELELVAADGLSMVV